MTNLSFHTNEGLEEYTRLSSLLNVSRQYNAEIHYRNHLQGRLDEVKNNMTTFLESSEKNFDKNEWNEYHFLMDIYIGLDYILNGNTTRKVH
jgi:hypothetical protein